MRINILLFALIVLFVSCKKTDESPPDIIFELPFGFPTLNLPDQIVVKANVQDDRNLQWVKLDIINTSNQRISDEINFNPEGSPTFVIEEILELFDVHIESGIHYIRIRAFDGHNEGVGFKEIQINEVPTQLERIVLIDKNISDFKIDFIDHENNFVSGPSYSGRVEVVSPNSLDGELVLGINSPTSIISLTASDFSLLNNTSVLDDGAIPFFRSSVFDDQSKTTYISQHTGEIRGFKKNGSQVLNFDINDGFRPGKIAVFNNYLVIEEISNDENTRYLSLYQKNLGTLIQSASLNMELVGIQIVQDRIIVIGQDDGLAQVAEFNTDFNLINVIDNSLGINEPIASGLSKFNDNIYISDNEKTISYEVMITQCIPTSEWNITTNQFSFNKVNQNVYGINESGLFQLISGNAIIEIEGTSDYENFELIFNK